MRFLKTLYARFFFRIKGDYLPFLLIARIKTGNKTRFVIVPTTNVREVNQPKALVPPNPLKQKIIKPAIRTREV
jgi:hypothetical protein